MAIGLTDARPYAKAAFDIAREASTIDAWQAILCQAAEVFSDHDLCYAFANPKLSEALQFQMLEKSFQFKDDAIKYFFKLVVDNHRIRLLPFIAMVFESLKAEYEKSQDVTLTTTMPLTEEQRTRIRKALEIRLQRQVTITEELDELLLGGLMIRAGDQLIDGSGLGRLQQLRQKLEGSEI